MRRFGSVVLSCEHAGNRIPRAYTPLFAPHRALLATHRGLDLGALRAAQGLARRLDVPLYACTWSRLLVEANRSLHHPGLFSEVTRPLPAAERQGIIDRCYHPHRQRITAALRSAQKPVLHLAIHSFTPSLAGQQRNADAGLLYDPRRPRERATALSLQKRWRRLDQDMIIRRNYPYRGSADGLTTALRRALAPDAYAGLEVELNQRHVGSHRWTQLVDGLAASIKPLVVNP